MEMDLNMSPSQTDTRVLPIREVLDKLNETAGHPSPQQLHPRDLDHDHDNNKLADEIENNIRQLQMPVKEKTPLQLIAGAFQELTYGTMMQFSQELKASGMQGSPEEIAATLHKWALNHGSIVIPVTPMPPAESTTTTTEEVKKTPLPEVTIATIPPAEQSQS